MQRLIFETEADLAAAVAKKIADAIREKPDLVLGLPTGRTPITLYSHLAAQKSSSSRLDWSRVRTFNLDEFVGCGEGDAGSYRMFMHELLFRHVNIKRENIGFLDGRAADLDAECERYEKAIAAAGGIDLMILGIGANGHLAFNEPDNALQARTHRAELTDRTRAGNAMWFEGDLWRVPHEALTMGMGTILAARSITLIATGEAKAPVVRQMMQGPVTTRLPASFLQLHDDVTAALDEAACIDLN